MDFDKAFAERTVCRAIREPANLAIGSVEGDGRPSDGGRSLDGHVQPHALLALTKFRIDACPHREPKNVIRSAADSSVIRPVVRSELASTM